MKLTVLIILLLSFNSTGQEITDSLLSVWKDKALTNEVRLKAIHTLSSELYLYSQPDSAVYFAKQEYDFAKSKGLRNEMAKALDVIGIASSISGNYAEAMELHERSLILNKKTKNKTGIAYSLKYIGNVHLKKSDYAHAIDFYTNSLILFEGEGNDQLSASVINNIGLVYMDLNDYDKALTELKRALSIYKTIDANADESNTLNNIGTVYRLKEDYENALHFYKRSLALKQNNGIDYGIAICYSNIGIIHSKLRKNSLAMEFFNRGLTIHKKVGNRKGISNSLVHIGTIYLKSNNDSSIVLGKEALAIAQEIGSTEEIGKAAELLFLAYKAEGNYALALEMHELFQKIEREILSSKNQREVLRHEYQYSYDKKISCLGSENAETAGRR